MLNNNFNLTNKINPDYDGLVRYLIEPLLESPHLFSFDCEQLSSTKRVWIRLAFEDNEKGKIYGRGGRNIQAIRTVLETAAQATGDTLYLEIYEGQNRSRYKPSSRVSRPRTSSFAPSTRERDRESDNDFSRRPIRRRRDHYNRSRF